MRFMGYILAIFLLLLSVVPCCAFDDCPDDKQEIADQHQPGDEDCGNCSPFFSCDACAAATVDFEPFLIVITPLSHQPVIYTGYIPLTLRDAKYDFWQPPRMG